jgi:glucose-6-phosphate-specific signal transduction histidine kinase
VRRCYLIVGLAVIASHSMLLMVARIMADKEGAAAEALTITLGIVVFFPAGFVLVAFLGHDIEFWQVLITFFLNWLIWTAAISIWIRKRSELRRRVAHPSSGQPLTQAGREPAP